MAKSLNRQLWFSWLTVLHERLGKRARRQRCRGQKKLKIARRRWLERNFLGTTRRRRLRSRAT